MWPLQSAIMYGFAVLLCSLQKLPSCGWSWMLTCRCLSFSVYCIVVKSPLVVIRMSPCVSSTTLHHRSSGVPFLVYLESLSTYNFFSLSGHLKVHGRKVIVLVQFVATSFSFPYYFCHCGLGCCQLCSYALPVLSQAYFCVSSCVALFCVVWYKNICAYWEYIFWLYPSSEQKYNFISSQIFWRVVKSWKVLFRISYMSFISYSLSQFPSFVSTSSLLSMKCRNWRMCKFLLHFIVLVRMEYKTSLFLSISLSVGFMSNVPFVLLLPET